MVMAESGDFENFQFFVVCDFVKRSKEGRLSLRDIVTRLTVKPGEPYDLWLQASAIVSPKVAGKRLAIEAWQLFSTGMRSPIQEAFRFALPEKTMGPWFYGEQLEYSPTAECVASFRVVDLDGAFGPSGAVLSTFKFLVQMPR